MDKQGNIWTPEEVQQRLGELTGAKDMDRKIEAVRRKAQASSVSSEEIQQIQGVLSRPVKKDVSQKKVSLSEYLSSPEVSTETEDSSRAGATGSFRETNGVSVSAGTEPDPGADRDGNGNAGGRRDR